MVPNRGEHVQDFALLRARITYTISREQRQAQTSRHLDRGLVARLLFAIEMALKLDVDVAAPEDLAQPLDARLPIADCRLPIENRRLHLLQSAIVNRKSAIPRPEPRTPNPGPERSFVAAAQTDQPGSVLGQLLLGYSTLSFPGAQFHARDEAAEVLIPRARLDQNRIPEALGRGNFGADVSANASLLRRHVKAWSAVDAVAVEERHGRYVQLRAQGDQLLRRRCALEKAEGGSGMEFHVHKTSVVRGQ